MMRWIWRNWRMLSALLLGLCLLTSFLASEPLYSGRVLDAQALGLIEGARAETLNITVSNPVPVESDVMEILTGEFGPIMRATRHYNRAVGPPLLPPNGMLCGYDYVPGEPITAASRFVATPSDSCYEVYSFDGIEELFTLASGRWPENLQSPVPEQAGVPNIMGDAQVEAVLTTTAADTAGINLGDMLVIGNQADRTVIVRVVGLLEPVSDSSSSFWNSRYFALTGAMRPYGLLESRYDLGLIVTEDAFENWIHPIAEVNSYVWWLEIDRGRLDGTWLTRISGMLSRVETRLRLDNPDIDILNGMEPLVTTFTNEVARTEKSARWLAGIELGFFLLMLTILAGLALDWQRAQWVVMVHRGIGRWQLVVVYCLIMGLLGLVAGFIGPFGASGLVSIAQNTGVLIQTGTEPVMATVSNQVILTSWLAAGLGVVALSIRVLFITPNSLLKSEGHSLPPRRTIIKHYYLDVLLILVGTMLVWRMISLGETGLDDPFNVVGPVLLVSGLTMIWVRIFPSFAWLAGKALASFNRRIFPLMLWKVERDPASYMALIMLVTGAMAFGTAALTFNVTQDIGAWEAAQHEVGADVSAEVDLLENPSSVDWYALPGVVDMQSLVVLDGRWRTGGMPVRLLGLDPMSMAKMLPGQQEMLAALDSASPPLSGLVLPVGTQEVTLQVYSVPNLDTMTRVALELNLTNDIGASESVLMSAVTPPESGEFQTFSGTLPVGPEGHMWRTVGLRFLSERDEVDFTHTVYLDNMIAVDQQGRAVLLEDFETSSDLAWLPDTNQNPDSLTVSLNTQYAAEGASSLQVNYRIRNVRFTEIHPVLAIYPVPNVPVPVLVSEGIAEEIGKRTNDREIIGSANVLDLNLPLGNFSLSYQVLGVIRVFPGTSGGQEFVVVPGYLMLNRLNANLRTPSPYSVNRVWLTLSSHEPQTAFRVAVAGSPDIHALTYAWDVYTDLQHASLSNVVAAILHIGFVTVLILSILGSGFYFAILFRRNRIQNGILQVLGWNTWQVWWLLVGEQIILLLPALVVGAILGELVIGIMLPFLTPIDNVSQSLPFAGICTLLVGVFFLLVTVFVVVARSWRRIPIPQMLRTGAD